MVARLDADTLCFSAICFSLETLESGFKTPGVQAWVIPSEMVDTRCREVTAKYFYDDTSAVLSFGKIPINKRAGRRAALDRFIASRLCLLRIDVEVAAYDAQNYPTFIWPRKSILPTGTPSILRMA